jgi:hypothetical protein
MTGSPKTTSRPKSLPQSANAVQSSSSATPTRKRPSRTRAFGLGKHIPARETWLKSDADTWADSFSEIRELYDLALIDAYAELLHGESDALTLATILRATALHEKEIHIPSLETLRYWMTGDKRKETLA